MYTNNMAFKNRSSRYLVRKTRRRFLFTIILAIFLIYATLQWVLPNFVSALGLVTDYFKPQKHTSTSISDQVILAPPVINIPYEATNSFKIDIQGYAIQKTKVKIFVDDLEKAEVDVNEDGSFVAEDINLSLGTNNIYGKTIDQDQKESLPSKLIKLIFDDEKPKLEVLEPADGKEVTGDKKVTVTGKTDKDNEVSINGIRTITDIDGKFSAQISLNDGENIITIQAQDEATNLVKLERRVIFKP